MSDIARSVVGSFVAVDDIQAEHRRWLEKNFPDQLPHQPLLGLAEEVGELAHAHLKAEQRIRGMEDKAVAQQAKFDAVGDIFIYLLSYCNSNGIDLQEAIRRTWFRVSRRDWVKDPDAGGEK
jgi:NTP pyrophosphatase (non-canonical NTP hydrolase)